MVVSDCTPRYAAFSTAPSGNFALGYIAPDRNQQLAGERNDRDPADPPAFSPDAGFSSFPCQK
jgi:hypothetical protein